MREYLRSQDLLLNKFPPQRLLQKTLHDDEDEKPLGDIADAFSKYPQLPIRIMTMARRARGFSFLHHFT